LLGITDRNFDNLWLLVIITNLSTLLPAVGKLAAPPGITENSDPKLSKISPRIRTRTGHFQTVRTAFMALSDLVPTACHKAAVERQIKTETHGFLFGYAAEFSCVFPILSFSLRLCALLLLKNSSRNTNAKHSFPYLKQPRKGLDRADWQHGC